MNKKYNEEKLSHDFLKDLITKIDLSFNTNRSFNLVSSQGIGTSLIFKYLFTHRDYQYIYVDCDHFADSSLEEFYRHLLKAFGAEEFPSDKKELLRLLDKNIDTLLLDDRKIVVIIAHFDLLKKCFNKELFDLVKYIRSKQSDKFSFIFNTYTPLVDLLQDKLQKINTNLIGQTIYLKPYNSSDLEELAEKLLFLDTEDPWVQKAMKLSGGSYYLLTLLSRTERYEQPLADPFIKMYFKRIMEGLSIKRRKMIEQVGQGKGGVEVDSYLLGLGLIDKTDQGYQLFTPLFTEYIKQNASLKFSAGEKRLFQLLKQKIGKVINKDEIFEYVWGEDNEASDWALNSMIYRIRNNPVFREQGYEIESFKKVGYRLIKD
jgi:hypothetical protein